MKDLSKIFKAYDIRGVYPDQLDEDAARRIGRHSLASWRSDASWSGRDMRASSPPSRAAFIGGRDGRRREVVDVGQVSTDALYFASGWLDLPGAMFTASHNPARYNGLKLCRRKAAPIGEDSGLHDILRAGERTRLPVERRAGQVEERDIIEALREPLPFLRRYVIAAAAEGRDRRRQRDGRQDRPDRVRTASDRDRPALLRARRHLPEPPCQPDRTREPHRSAEGRARSRAAMSASRSTAMPTGCSWSTTAAELVAGSTTTRWSRERMLRKNPGETVIYNLICSWTVPEVIKENGGDPVRTRVGHSFIKEVMAETGAIFGGEHSGHYYFRDNFRADSGMIAALFVLEAMSDVGRAALGDARAVQPLLRLGRDQLRGGRPAGQRSRSWPTIYSDGKQDRTDGLTVEYEDWWFNCRPSNTEPLLRLNLEARTEELMEDQVGRGAGASSGAEPRR